MTAPSLGETAVTELLRRSGLSISALARRAGVSRASVSEYAHGHRQPRVGQLRRLAHAADLEVQISFATPQAARAQELADVLALADALPLRPQPRSVPTWAEITGPR